MAGFLHQTLPVVLDMVGLLAIVVVGLLCLVAAVRDVLRTPDMPPSDTDDEDDAVPW